MRNKKWAYWNFKEYETDAFAGYLEQMAMKGWYLTKMPHRALMEFKRGEPEARAYSVAVAPGSSEFDSGEREEIQRFREYCEEAGWHFQCGNHIWQVFYTTEEHPIPIETDPELKLKNIREVLFPISTLVGVAVLDVIWAVMLFLLWKDPLDTLSSVKGLLYMVFLMFVLILITASPVCNWLWCRRAKRQIEQSGTFPPTDFRRVWIRDIGWTIVAVMFAIILCVMNGAGFMVRFGGALLGILICGWILSRIRERDNGTRGEKIRAYLVAAFAALLIYNGVFNTVTDRIFDRGRESSLPLYGESTFPDILESLDYRTAELFLRKDQRTPLAEHQKVYGYAFSPEGKRIHVGLRRYASSLKGPLARTLKTQYPIDHGNVWTVTETVRKEENGRTLVKYEYRPMEEERPAGVVDTWEAAAPRTLYVAYTDKEILSVDMESEGDDRILEALAKLP